MNQLPFKPVKVYKPTISDEDCDVLISCDEFKCGGDEALMYPVDKVEAYIRSLTQWNNTLPDGKPGPDYEGQDWVLVKAHEIDSGFELIPRVAEYNRMKERWQFIDAEDYATDNIFVTQWRIME